MRTHLIVAAGGCLLVSLAGGLGYREGYENAASRHRLAAAAAQLEQHAAASQTQAARARVDDTHYPRLKALEDENLALRTRLERGAIRMHVHTAGCAPAGGDAASVDDGTPRAELHPATAGDLAGLAGDADALAIQLKALQDWVRARPAAGAGP